MLKYIRVFLTKVFSFFNYELRSKNQYKLSDDPVFVLSKILEPENVNLIIDGGASIGDTSQQLSKLFPYAKVHAFEPFPKFLNVLYEKANQNPRIIVHPLALGKENCKKRFNINLSEGTNSLLQPSQKSKEIYGALMEPEATIEVSQKKLDDCIKSTINQNIDILKLDLQGGELDALKGAEKLFKAGRVKAILCELMFEKAYQGQASWIELASLIEDYGLRLFNIYQKHHYNGQIIQADLLFIHSSVLEMSKEKRTISFHKFSDILNSQSIQE